MMLPNKSNTQGHFRMDMEKNNEIAYKARIERTLNQILETQEKEILLKEESNKLFSSIAESLAKMADKKDWTVSL